MSIKKLWGTRTRANASTYIGERGTLFYNEVDGELRLSDGVTPGGVAISVRADLITAQRLTPGADNDVAYGLGDETHRWYDLHIGDGGIYFNGYATAQTVPYTPGDLDYSLIPTPTDASLDLGSDTHRWGDLYLGGTSLHLLDQTTGDDVSVSVVDGILYFNGASGLAVGPLFFEDNVLKTETIATDILVGETDDTGIFNIRRKAQFNNTTFSSTEAMVSINASGDATPVTLFPDTLLQTVGRDNKNSRIVQRAYGASGTVGGDNAYAVWASYVARGSIAAPESTKANDILMRLSGNGYGTNTFGTGGGARVEMVALENFTNTAKGSIINFWTVPLGQTASQNVASINSVGVVTAGIEFSGDETIQTTAGIPLTQKAVPSATYVATLGIDGKLDPSQIPSSLSGAVVFKGVWNATTNTPALSDTTPEGLLPGWEYIVDVGGTRDIGDGSKVFVSGDFVIFDGTHWKQVPSGNLFTSLTGGGGITVNQSTGAMVLGSTATALSTNGAIVSRDSSGNFAANMITANLTGAVTGTVSGNAGSVTNGFYTTSSFNLGTTSIAVNRASASQSLTGISIDGNAGTVTNGVYTTDTGTVTNTMLAGSIANAKLTNSTVTVNGTAIALGASGTVTAAAGTLTGTTLNATVVTSSLTTVGTLGSLAVTNGITATNYTGLVTQSIRNAGNVTGTTLTLNVTTDDIVRCTFTDAFTVAFSNIIAGRKITLIATNTSGADTDVITAGISSVNMQGDNTLTVSPQTTAVITYYSLDGDTANIYASAVYA